MMILQVEKQVQAAVDLGMAKPGGISWTQMRDNFFQAGKGGKLVPSPRKIDRHAGKIAGSSVRGGGSAKQKKLTAAKAAGSQWKTYSQSASPTGAALLCPKPVLRAM